MPIFALILLLVGGIVVASIASSSSAPAAAPAPALSSKPAMPAPAPAPASVAGSSQTGGQVVSTQAPAPAPASNWDRICAGMGTYYNGFILFTPEECSVFNNKINKDTAGNFGSAYIAGGATDVDGTAMYSCYYAFPSAVPWRQGSFNSGSYSYDCAVGI